MEEDKLGEVKKLIIIGGSSGSMEVVLQLLPVLSNYLQTAIVIVLHRKNFSDSALIELLSSKTSAYIKEAEDKECMQPGITYVAPADYHLLVEKNKTFSLDYSEKINYSRPSIDVSFETAADTFKKDLAAILLSGANADGAEGLITVKKCGGVVVVQDPVTASVPYMPKYAMEKVAVDFVLKPTQIAGFMNKFDEKVDN